MGQRCCYFCYSWFGYGTVVDVPQTIAFTQKKNPFPRHRSFENDITDTNNLTDQNSEDDEGGDEQYHGIPSQQMFENTTDYRTVIQEEEESQDRVDIPLKTLVTTDRNPHDGENDLDDDNRSQASSIIEPEQAEILLNSLNNYEQIQSQLLQDDEGCERYGETMDAELEAQGFVRGRSHSMVNSRPSSRRDDLPPIEISITTITDNKTT